MDHFRQLHALLQLECHACLKPFEASVLKVPTKSTACYHIICSSCVWDSAHHQFHHFTRRSRSARYLDCPCCLATNAFQSKINKGDPIHAAMRLWDRQFQVQLLHVQERPWTLSSSIYPYLMDRVINDPSQIHDDTTFNMNSKLPRTIQFQTFTYKSAYIPWNQKNSSATTSTMSHKNRKNDKTSSTAKSLLPIAEEKRLQQLRLTVLFDLVQCAVQVKHYYESEKLQGTKMTDDSHQSDSLMTCMGSHSRSRNRSEYSQDGSDNAYPIETPSLGSNNDNSVSRNNTAAQRCSRVTDVQKLHQLCFPDHPEEASVDNHIGYGLL